MKNRYLPLLISVACCMNAFAQPTLTQANFVPIIGETQLFYVADTNSVLDNTTGPNVIFDYSGLHGFGLTQTQYFIDPTTTPNTTDYPTATFTDTTGGFPGNLKYNQDFTDSLDIIGLILDINSFGTVVAKYDNNPEIVMKFPFNYGDSFSDAYGGQFTSVAAPLPTNGNGTVIVNADAWGTLKLPLTPDIDSVLRVTRVESLLTDTIFLQPLFPNILPIPINATQINYYKPSISKNSLVSYVIAVVNGDTTINVISQYPMNLVHVDKVDESSSFSVFPNPSNNENTTVAFNLEKKSNIEISILNNLGQLLENSYTGNLKKGQHQIKLKTSNLSAGMYVVNINVNNKLITKKLIIE